jgi:hypothetical protein
VRQKLACGCCNEIVQVAAAQPPDLRGMAGLWADVLVSKYGDHLPLYRQQEIYKCQGVDLDRAALAGWAGQTSALLQLLVEALRRHGMSTEKLHADDTPVVGKDQAAGDLATAPVVRLAYSPDRKGERPQEHLYDFRGILLATRTQGPTHFTRAGEFEKRHTGRTCDGSSMICTYSLVRAEALRRIAELYAPLEGDFATGSQKNPEERRGVLNERS